jgi:hypothetical protein
MKNLNLFRILSLGLAVLALPFFVLGQKNAPAAPQPQQLLKRVVSKSDKADFGAGGTITIIGAPKGSVTVEGWNKSEVTVTAEIELQAPTEEDLALLEKVNTFIFEPTYGRVNILTEGMHDKDYMKQTAKKFPKQLLTMPWKIDYVVHVPSMSDINVTMGKGDLKVTGVEGAMQLKGPETNADLDFTGGAVVATFGTGTVNVRIKNRSWRGRGLQLQLATGNLNIDLPPAFNADIDASILRTGEIKNYESFKERERGKFGDKLIVAKSGSGGALLSFIVGDGVLKFMPESLVK